MLTCKPWKRALHLWRATSATKVKLKDGFWADNPEYPQILHPSAPLWTGTLPIGSLICRTTGALTKDVIEEARSLNAAVLSVKAWDHPGFECVVFKPHELQHIRRVVKP